MKNNDKIKPILFSTPMVQAILENRKTQTRRTHGIEGIHLRENEFVDRCEGWPKQGDFAIKVKIGSDPGRYEIIRMLKNKYSVGDTLWVRETFRKDLYIGFDYKADYSERIISHPSNKGIWKPSIHMPKAAARIFLEVTEVRVERLFDISEKDAIAEGIIVIEPEEAYNSYDKGVGSYATARGSFFSLWTSINGQASLDANPWVWVYEFKRIGKPANF